MWSAPLREFREANEGQASSPALDQNPLPPSHESASTAPLVDPAAQAYGDEDEDEDEDEDKDEDPDITAAEKHIAPECRECDDCLQMDYGIHGTTLHQMCLAHSLACVSDAEERKRKETPAVSLREEYEQAVQQRVNERSQGWFSAPAGGIQCPVSLSSDVPMSLVAPSPSVVT